MKEKIKEIVASVLEISNVTDETSQKNCENWDSLHHLNLVVELEEAFDISFEPEEIAQMKSIDDIENIICKKKS